MTESTNDAGVADVRPHKYLPNSASDERCMQVRVTGPRTSVPCGEGPGSPVHRNRPLVFKNTTEGDEPGWSITCTCSPLLLINWEVAYGGECWTTWLADSQPEALARAAHHVATKHPEASRG